MSQSSPRALSSLTGGSIPYRSFEDFIRAEGPDRAKEITENFLGYKIQDSASQPLFDHQGNPLRYEDGRQICLPWAWTSCLANELIKRAGHEGAESVEALADTPVPFWKPLDVILVSSDGYVFMTLRSGATEGSVGTAFAAAAGSPGSQRAQQSALRRVPHRGAA